MFARIPLCLLAYPLLRVWYLLIVNFNVALPAGASVALVANTVILARIATDGAVALACDRIQTLGRRPWLGWAVPACLVAGTALVALSPFAGAAAGAALIAGALLWGVGSSTLFLAWDELFCGLRIEQLKTVVLWRMGLEALCTGLFFLPDVVALVASVVAIMGCGAGFYVASRKVSALADAADPGVREGFDGLSLPTRRWNRVEVSSAVPLFVGVVLLFTGITFIQKVFSVDPRAYGIGIEAAWLGRLVAFLLMAALLWALSDLHFELIFRAAIVLLIVGFLLLPLGNLSLAASAAIQAASAIAVIGVLLGTVAVGACCTCNPLRVLALGSVAVRGGNLLGSVAGGAVAALASSEAVVQGVSYVQFYSCALEVLVLAIAGMYLITERTVQRFVWHVPPHQLADEQAAFTRRLQAAAARYALTDREADVLRLLMEGRSIPVASEILFISPNTVKTHVRNIYTKLDVHNRKELMDLLDG